MRAQVGVGLLLAASLTAGGAWLIHSLGAERVPALSGRVNPDNEPDSIVAGRVVSQDSNEISSTQRVGDLLKYKAGFQLEVLGKSDAAPRTVIIGRATLGLGIVKETSTEVELAAQITDVSVTADSERQGADTGQKVSDSLKVPFAIHMTPNGRITSIAFPPEGNEIGAGIMRGLASALQFVRPQNASTTRGSWIETESDNLGEYTAEYSTLGSGEYKKFAKTYTKLELTKAFQVMKGQKGPTAHLEGTYRLDKDNRLAVANLSQTLSLPSSDDGTGSIISTYRLDLAEVSRGGKRIAGSDLWRKLPLGATLEVGEPTISEKQNREILGNGNWSSLQQDNLAAIKSGDDKVRLEVGRRMKALFELEPLRARDAVVALRRVQDSKEAQTILGALSGARVPEALTAIQDAALDKSGKSEVREAALGHLGLHDKPTAETLKALSTMAVSATDPVLRNQAIASLGTAAGKLAADPKATADDAALAKNAISSLNEQLKGAKDPQSQTLYLQALGNAGGKDILPSTASLLTSADPAVRQSAIFALRFVSGDEAGQLIVGALLLDTDATLRATAAQAAAFRTLTPSLLAGVAESLKTEQDGIVRSSVVECLASFVTQAPNDVRPLLEWVSKNDPQQQIRDSAQKVLNSVEGA